MQTIAAAKFKEQCLRILDELDSEGVIVTKRGKPVAKVTPIVERTNDGDLIGAMKGPLGIRGDIMDSESAWEPDPRLFEELYGKYRDRITVHGDVMTTDA